MIRLVEILATGVTDDSGLVVSSGTVTSYSAGTTTLQTLYQDFECTIPHANPLTLDDAGRAIAYASNRVKLVIADSAGDTVRTIDNVGTADSDVSGTSTTVTAGSGLVANGSALDVNVDGTTIEIASNQLGVKDEGISASKLASDAVTTVKILDANVTKAKLAALGQQVSSSCSNYTTNSGSFVSVTNLSVTITTTGRPVFVGLIPDGSANTSYVGVYEAAGTAASGDLAIDVGGTDIGVFNIYQSVGGATSVFPRRAVSSIWIVDVRAAGTYTYTLQAKLNAGDNVYVYYAKLVAYEL